MKTMAIDDIRRISREFDTEMQRLFVPGEAFEIERRSGWRLTRLQRDRLRMPLFQRARSLVERYGFSADTVNTILVTKLLSTTISFSGVGLVTLFDLLELADG